MVKALKLFAKNHKQLDQICQPQQKSGLFSQRRKNDVNVIKASTKQKEGCRVPKGPIHNTFNEFIETELFNYKNIIEENFHASTMKDYKFLRVENDYVHTMNTQNSCDLGKIRK